MEKALTRSETEQATTVVASVFVFTVPVVKVTVRPSVFGMA